MLNNIGIFSPYYFCNTILLIEIHNTASQQFLMALGNFYKKEMCQKQNTLKTKNFSNDILGDS